MRERIDIDARGAIHTLDEVAEGYDKVGEAAEQATGKIQNSFGERAKKALGEFGQGARTALGGIGSFFKGAIDKTAIGQFIKLGQSAKAAKAQMQDLAEEIDGIMREQMQFEPQGYPNQSDSSGYMRLWNRVQREHSGLFTAMGVFEKEYDSAIQGRQEAIRQVFSKGAKAVRIFGSAFKDAAGIVKRAGGAIGTRIREIATRSMSLEGATKRVTKAINGITSVASRMLTRMGIRAVFSGVGEAMKSLAGESENFNRSLSSMIGGTQQFGRQLVAAFEPLINAVAPIITAITNQMTAAMRKVAEFSSTITGQNYFYEAADPAYDYAKAMGTAADSTDEAASATTAAAKAQAQYNAEIYGFETLHKLNGGSSTLLPADTAGLTKAADQTAAAFKKINTAAGDNTWAKKLRADFKAGDWTKLGKDLASFAKEGLGKIQNAIKWDTVGNKITKFTDAITGTARSLIADKDLWATAGDTIAAGINTISYTLRNIDGGLSFKDLGDSLGVAINNGVDDTDWQAIGNNIGAFFMIPWEMFCGFVRQIDPTSLGEAIKSTLGGFFERFDAGTIGGSIGTFVTKTADTIRTAFGEKSTWENIGEKIKEGLRGFFDTFDAKTVADAINTMLRGIITTIGTLLKDEELKKDLAGSIGEMLKGLDWGAIITLFSPILAATLVSKLAPIIATSLGKSIISGIAAKLAGGGATAAAGAAGTAVLPVLAGGAGAVAAVATGATAIQDAVKARKAYKAGDTELGEQYVGRSIDKIGGIGAGAAAGALIGSVVPVIGTGVGALVGAGIGGAISTFATRKKYGTLEDPGATTYITPEAQTSSIQDQVAAGMRQALAEQNQKAGDIVLRVGYEDLARASLKGQRIINNRNNAFVSFV